MTMQNEENHTVVCPMFLRRDSGGRAQLGTEPKPPPSEKLGNIPRVTRLMALAIKLGADLDSGRLTDLADIARSGSITRARATQIMNLLHLAPDIQEALLFLPRTTKGRAPVTERELRELAIHVDWGEQRKVWRAMQ